MGQSTGLKMDSRGCFYKLLLPLCRQSSSQRPLPQQNQHSQEQLSVCLHLGRHRELQKLFHACEECNLVRLLFEFPQQQEAHSSTTQPQSQS